MNTTNRLEVKVGLFVVVGIALSCTLLILVGGSRDIFQRKCTYHVLLPQVEGMTPGSIVKMAGFRIGQIQDMQIQDSGQVDVAIQINKKFADRVKTDSLVQVGTQGVLGDKYINITVGSPQNQPVPDGSVLNAERSKEFKDYLSKGDQILENLNSTLSSIDSILKTLAREGRAETISKNLQNFSTSAQTAGKDMQTSMSHLKNLLGKIDAGQGTVGALINDPSLYEDLKALLGGANRNKVLKYFIKKSVEDHREEAKSGSTGNSGSP